MKVYNMELHENIEPSPRSKFRPASILTKSINLTPTPGTIIHLPSGKTAIAHGSGLEKLKSELEKPIPYKKSSSVKQISNLQPRPKHLKRPAKFLTITLEEILEMYDKSLSQVN
jgi:hypothetical protein